MDTNLKRIAEQFAIKGSITDIVPTGNGHINKTFKVTTDRRVYILQKINSTVFTNIDELMTNIVSVTEHLLEEDVFTLVHKPTLKGALYLQQEDSYYRIYKYIPDCYCYEKIPSVEIAKKYGEAFGKFHDHVSDLDASRLYETIPNFHNTPLRYKQFLKSINKDVLGRVEEVKSEIKFLSKNTQYLDMITNALENKTIPNRVVHNDPKINNVLFDKENGNVKCIIDLDTVMPGSCLYDIGDGLRSIFTGDNEDNKDTSNVKVDLDIYKACLEGYYSKTRNTLVSKEIELLPYSVLLMSLELSLRFLTDYIDGDTYFAISRPDHNLDRARSQIALAKDILANLDKMIEITKEVCR